MRLIGRVDGRTGDQYWLSVESREMPVKFGSGFLLSFIHKLTYGRATYDVQTIRVP